MQQKINREKKIREKLRRELLKHAHQDDPSWIPEDDLHSEPTEDWLHFDFVEDNHLLDSAEGNVRARSERMITYPEPAENGFHPKNRIASMNPEISEAWGWADVRMPFFRCKDAALSGEAENSSRDDASEPQGALNSVDLDDEDRWDEPDQMMPEDEQHPASNGSGQSPLYDLGAPMMTADDEQHFEIVGSG